MKRRFDPKAAKRRKALSVRGEFKRPSKQRSREDRALAKIKEQADRRKAKAMSAANLPPV